MRAVKSKNTGAEMVVRRLAHSLGYRYRLHRRDLPGVPDLVFPSRRAVIFVHGCFWHQHDCARGARTPKSRTTYWEAKLRRNRERDERHQRQLQGMRWSVLVVWECELRDHSVLEERLRRFLDGGNNSSLCPQPDD